MTISRQRPRAVFFGGGGGQATIHLTDSGVLDGTTAYRSLARTNAILPAQPSVDLICYATYVLITTTDISSFNLVATLILDDVVHEQHISVVAGHSGQKSQRLEFPWKTSVRNDALAIQANLAPRGRKIQVEIAVTSGLPTGKVVVDGVECDVESVGETVAVPFNPSP